MPRVNIEMNMKLPVKLIKRKNWYIANCPVLDVASQGETPTKAKKNLVEALSVFLITCLESGTLSAVLHECGFKPSPAKKSKQTRKEDYVNIPIHLLSNQSCQSRCHA